MVYNNYNIQEFRKELRNARTQNSLNSIVRKVLMDIDWNNFSMNKEFETLLTEIKFHKQFNEKSLEMLLTYLPNINNQVYSQKSISIYIASLITSDFISEKEIRMIYEKFGKSVTVAKALAINSNTPKDILEKLAFHEQYSVVAEIANNTGKDAIELLRNPEMAQRVLLAEILINGYTKHLKH